MKTREFAPVTLEELKTYSVAAADPNPIHLDETVAKAAGLPGIIAHGMLVAGRVAETAMADAAETSPGARIKKLRFRFRAMTHLGDSLTVRESASGAGSWEAVTGRGEVAVVGRFEIAGRE